MENQTREDIAGLPAFANVPFLGTLFRATKQISKKSELVILLRPIIVRRGTMTHSVIKAKERLRGLKRGFHVGSRPDIFGTEAEKPIVPGPKSGVYGSERFN